MLPPLDQLHSLPWCQWAKPQHQTIIACHGAGSQLATTMTSHDADPGQTGSNACGTQGEQHPGVETLVWAIVLIFCRLLEAFPSFQNSAKGNK